MGAVSLLTYPKKSHRKRVHLPEHSAALSEFFGIMLGDGGINNTWQSNITLNSIADADYAVYVKNLCKSLFNIEPTVTMRKKSNALVIKLTSTTLVDYLVDEGLVRGNKISGGMSIPGWIMENKEYAKACVRGLVDTDGCLYIHRHTIAGKSYKNIGFCFTSYAPTIIRQVGSIFELFAIIPHSSGRGRKIYLYSQHDVERYLDIFGSSNQRIHTVYRMWRGG